MTASTVRVGVDPVDGAFGNGDDVIQGEANSSVRSIRINGAMSADSYFVAGSFPTDASIGGQSVATASRPLKFRTNLDGPIVTGALADDTGLSSTDGLTSNPAITGTVTDTNGVAAVSAGFTSTPTVNVLSDLQPDGSFTFTRTRLEEINGSPLSDGSHILTLLASDTFGNSRQTSVTFTLDTTAPALTFDLDTASDTGPTGDQQTTAETVTLIGQTEANALVELLGVGLTTTADASGVFSITGVPLTLGANALTMRATDVAGNQRTENRTITRLQVNQAPVLGAIGNQTVDEEQLLTFTATATDSDVPAQTPTFSLANGASGSVPTGATIDPNTGVFSWTPTEAQGPGTFTFDVMVSDGALTDSETITVTVNEIITPSFQPLGVIPGGGPSTLAYGVSADGSVVVGIGVGSSGNEAFRWTEAGGIVGLGDLAGGTFSSRAWDISADGTVIVGQGTSVDGTEAFRWTAEDGMVGLGDLPGGSFFSRAWNVSADGTVIVGESSSAAGFQAFRWTAAEGMVALGDLPGGGFSSVAYAASVDGSVIVGQSHSASGPETFRWTAATGMVGLGDLPGGVFDSYAHELSEDGNVIIGRANSAGGQEVFRWIAAGAGWSDWEICPGALTTVRQGVSQGMVPSSLGTATPRRVIVRSSGTACMACGISGMYS